MPTSTATPNKWRKRLAMSAIIGLLMGASFVAGVAVTAIVAARILLPIAATGVTVGMLGLASAATSGAMDALASGDSEMRRVVLTSLKQSFDAQPAQQFDAQTAARIRPAIDQCRCDNDPEVAALADELIEFIDDHTLPALR